MACKRFGSSILLASTRKLQARRVRGSGKGRKGPSPSKGEALVAGSPWLSLCRRGSGPCFVEDQDEASELCHRGVRAWLVARWRRRRPIRIPPAPINAKNGRSTGRGDSGNTAGGWAIAALMPETAGSLLETLTGVAPPSVGEPPAVPLYHW